jgi:uncharacterized protein YxjI
MLNICFCRGSDGSGTITDTIQQIKHSTAIAQAQIMHTHNHTEISLSSVRKNIYNPVHIIEEYETTISFSREIEMDTETQLHQSFMQDQYLFRKKVFKIFGGAFHVYDNNQCLVFYSKQKAFKLKEDFRIYADERMAEELLTIKTPQILDLGATYYVEDPITGEPVGAIRRRGFKSIFKDEWIFLSAQGHEIAKLTEKSMLAALCSRLINLIPQKYIITAADGTEVADIKQHFNPFVLKYTMTILQDNPVIDRRLIVSAGILLASIEGRQES